MYITRESCTAFEHKIFMNGWSIIREFLFIAFNMLYLGRIVLDLGVLDAY